MRADRVFFYMLSLLTAVFMAGAASAHGLSVMDAGAVGDGRTDDTAAFRRALSKSRTVHIPYTGKGYRTTGTLDMTDRAVTAEPGATVIFSNTTSGMPAVLFDGAKTGFDVVKPHGSLDGLSIRLDSPNTTGVKMHKTRRVTLNSVSVYSKKMLPGTAGVVLDGPGEGSANNIVNDVFAFRCGTGVLMDTSDGADAWCNRNQVQGFLQSCVVGLDMRAASTNTINVATQACGTGVSMGDRSRYNTIRLYSENDETSLELSDKTLGNRFSGLIPVIDGSGFNNTFMNIAEDEDAEGTPMLAMKKTESGNYWIGHEYGSTGNTVLATRDAAGENTPVLTLTGGDDPVAVFNRDIRLLGRWDSPHLRMGPLHIWVDDRGILRYKRGAPQFELDGMQLVPGMR